MGTSTGIQRRRNRDETARRAAEIRASQRRRDHRRRILAVVGSAVGVLAVVAVLIVVAVTSDGGRSGAPPRHPAPADVVAAVTGVPAATLDAVGAGTATQVPGGISDPPLSLNGHPEVLYIGSEYCPYCAAERWALVQAMSRFGTWSGLNLTTSGANDVFPNTPTFTFYGAGYTSSYLAFVGKELYTNQPAGRHYQPLDRLTDAEKRLFSTHTNGFPFVDFGGAFTIKGATYDPSVLKGLSATQIARSLSDPTNPVAKAINGAANGTTAALCKLTGGKPAQVCTAPGVTVIGPQIGR
jgi:Domain of unknown function (DUF929)